ncbi:MAG: DUF3352 domain-containing protein [Actinomycetota bacterium]
MDDERRPPDQPQASTPPPPPGTPSEAPGSPADTSPVVGGDEGAPPEQPPHTAGDTWSAGDPATSGTKRNVGLIAVVIVAAIVVVAGAAIATTMYLLREADEALATKVPASADVFGAVYLDPSATQKVNLFRLTEKFPALGGEEELASQVDTMLDDALAGQNLESEDLTGWVGSQVGFAGAIDGGSGEPQGALLVDIEDEEAARAGLAKLRESDPEMTWQEETYGGADLWISVREPDTDVIMAIVDGTVVIGNERAFVGDIIDTANGDLEALDGAPRYEDALADLPEGKLGVMYVDIGSLVEQAMQQTDGLGLPDAAGTVGLGGIDPEAFGGMAMAASAEPNGIVVDISVQIDVAKLPPQIQDQLGTDPGPNDILAQVPTDSFAVFAATGIDRGLQQSLDQLGPLAPPELAEFGLTGEDGVIANLTGDMALTVAPTATAKVPTGALLIGTEDEAGMQVFLDTIAPFVSQGLSSAATFDGAGGFMTDDAMLTKPAPLQWQTETYQGVTISYLQDRSFTQMGVRPAYAVANGSGVLSSTVEEIKNVIDTADGESIQTDTTFTESLAAMGDQDQSLFYLNIQGIKEAAQSSDPGSIPPEVDENLEPLKAFVVGSRSTGDAQTAKLLLLIK